ncbi:hypothetical protein M422DRAFT_276479 [Sphaerobolus stellatus SS14]|uniref:Uncharacterized protein n=1 Tax=Sphaerobolus stellatus (strain SS14) TaxID=990650 RepID=A0A0C9UC54_SPHS4|nr:hypothetical protein M422DRAFT_276479 [Sphaerobolus stellatus SS14]
MEQDAGRKRKRKSRDTGTEERADTLKAEWPVMSADTFFEALTKLQQAEIQIQATIDTSELIPVDLSSKERADGLLSTINDVMDLYWSSHSSVPGRSLARNLSKTPTRRTSTIGPAAAEHRSARQTCCASTLFEKLLGRRAPGSSRFSALIPLLYIGFLGGEVKDFLFQNMQRTIGHQG